MKVAILDTTGFRLRCKRHLDFSGPFKRIEQKSILLVAIETELPSAFKRLTVPANQLWTRI